MPAIGFIVNPVAGLGGPAGLNGSDGSDVQAEARRLGFEPNSCARAVRFLLALVDSKSRCELFTGAGALGEEAALLADWKPRVVYRSQSPDTKPGDTKSLATRLCAEGIDLLVFVGGDGTARDVAEAVGDHRLCLGVPAGVKMQSSVFAVTPEGASALTREVLAGRYVDSIGEVVDIDEGLRRQGRLASKLYASLRVPTGKHRVQGRKMGSGSVNRNSLEGIARECISRFRPGHTVLLGPGTTVQAVSQMLGIQGTLLGVDVWSEGQLAILDANAHELENLVASTPVQLVVSPIGGQGVILGRGNQQIDEAVLAGVATEDLLILCEPSKLAELGGGPLFVDLATPEANLRWSGYQRVIVGAGQEAVVKVTSS